MDDILRQKLRDFFTKDSSAFAGIVKAVDKAKLLCAVELVEEPDITLQEVRLRATDDDQDKGLILFPEVGSDVLVAGIKNTTAFYVAMFSKIDTVVWKTEKEDLKSILEDLLNEIQALKVQTGMGPSSVPINVLQFKDIQNRILKFFE